MNMAQSNTAAKKVQNRPICGCGNIAVCGLLFDNKTYYCCGCCPTIDCENNDNWDIIDNWENVKDIRWLTRELKRLEEL